MSKPIDLIGQRFGKLTVVQFDRVDFKCDRTRKRKLNLWECKCDCGETVLVSSVALLSGNTKSCGCLKKEYYGKSAVDLTGQRFGMLTAVRPTNQRERRYIVWECRCDCGNVTYVRTGNLKNGNTKSCGCLRDEAKKKKE